jgi:hypothetical protein
MRTRHNRHATPHELHPSTTKSGRIQSIALALAIAVATLTRTYSYSIRRSEVHEREKIGTQRCRLFIAIVCAKSERYIYSHTHINCRARRPHVVTFV